MNIKQQKKEFDKARVYRVDFKMNDDGKETKVVSKVIEGFILDRSLAGDFLKIWAPKGEYGETESHHAEWYPVKSGRMFTEILSKRQ